MAFMFRCHPGDTTRSNCNLSSQKLQPYEEAGWVLTTSNELTRRRLLYRKPLFADFFI